MKNSKEVAIEKLEKRIAILQKDIFAFNPLSEGVTKHIELQKGIASLSKLSKFATILNERQEADFALHLKFLFDEILETQTHDSTSVAENAVNYYKYKGLQDAYTFLASL